MVTVVPTSLHPTLLPLTLQSPQYLEFDDSVTFLLFMYLFAEGDAVLAVQDSAVDIQGG